MQYILKRRLEIIAFVSGAVLMTVELVGSRVISPYLGVSTFIWTSIIGVILGFLSLGYWYGGRLSLKDPNIKTLSKILFLSFLSIILILFLEPFLSLFSLVRFDILFLAIVASIILFGPMSFCLGMVSPYVARLKIDSAPTSGSTVGTLYAISTLGSILGTFLGGFILISFLGTAEIIFLSAILIFLTFIVASLGDFSKEMFFFGILILLSSLFLLRSVLGGITDIDTLYNRWIIVDSINKDGEDVRYLRNNIIGTQSGIYKNDPTNLLFPYLQAFDVAPDIKKSDKDLKEVLLIGAGAFTYPSHFASKYEEVNMDVVEIDGGLKKIAEDFFQFKNTSQFSIYNTDARIFLKNNKKKYDVIFMDAFSSELSVPYHLTTIETMKDLNESISDEGAIVVNIISAVEGKNSKFAGAIYNTYLESFPYVYIFSDPSVGKKRVQNLILIASKTKDLFNKEAISAKIVSPWRLLDNSVFDKTVPILTDDFAPVERYISGFLADLTKI